MAWPFLALARAAGRDTSQLSQQLGLSESQLQDSETRVPLQQLCDLLRTAIETTGERDLGLLAAHYVDSSHFGIGEYIARSRPTLRDALRSTIRFLPLLSEGAHCSLVIHGKDARVTFWLDHEITAHEAAYEFAAAIGLMYVRRTTGAALLAPREVRFVHPAPARTTRHQALFGCPITFGAERTEIAFSSNTLHRRMVSVEPGLDTLLTLAAERMLEQLPVERRTVVRVQAEFARHDELQVVSAERVAQRIGYSVRTLHRRLVEEGTSYRAVLDGVRATLARRWLEEHDEPVAQIAQALGFARVESFHRSFKRWTGTTAAQHRSRARSGARKRAAPLKRRSG